MSSKHDEDLLIRLIGVYCVLGRVVAHYWLGSWFDCSLLGLSGVEGWHVGNVQVVSYLIVLLLLYDLPLQDAGGAGGLRVLTSDTQRVVTGRNFLMLGSEYVGLTHRLSSDARVRGTCNSLFSRCCRLKRISDLGIIKCRLVG